MEENINFSNTDLSDKENRILNAALTIFEQKGFSASTTSEIAKAAGVAEGTIFRYYNTKKHLLKELLKQLIELFGAEIALAPIEKILTNTEGKTQQQIFKEIIYDRMKFIDKNFALCKVVISEAMFHDDIRKLLVEKFIKKIYVAFSGFYNKMVESGEVRPLPTNIVNFSVLGNIIFFVLSKKVFKIEGSENDIDADIDILIDIMMNGIKSQ